MIISSLFLVILLIIGKVNAQITALLNGTTISIFPFANLTSNNSTVSINHAAFTPNSIYTLRSDNSIQILNKLNSSEIINHLNVSLPPSLTLQMRMMFDENYITMAIYGSSLMWRSFYQYNIANSSNIMFSQQYAGIPLPGLHCSFIAKGIYYQLFRDVIADNIVYFPSLFGNLNLLPFVNSQISVSPDRRYAILWTKYSQFYIYSISTSFTLLRIYNGSYGSTAGITQGISFSSDSTLAILETDSYHPIRIINLSGFTVTDNITINEQIISADFIDTNNRYIFINCQSRKVYCYDTVTDTLSQFSGSFIADQLIVDHNSSQIMIGQSGKITTLMSIQIKNATFASNVTNATNTTSPINASNTTNVTINQTIKIEGNPKHLNHQFSYQIQFSSDQNYSLQRMAVFSSVISRTVINFYSFVFSSPFTCLFLGFLNYFTLNSLYVLLNIQLPQIIFSQLSSFYYSINSNILTFFNIQLSMPLLTDQLTNEDRALYFGVSSDLVLSNYYSFGLIFANIIIVEICLLIKKCISKQAFLYQILNLNSQMIYFGLIVSSMVGLILPNKFVMRGQIWNFQTKLNVICQCLLYGVLFYFLCMTFISTFNSSCTNYPSNMKEKNSKIQFNRSELQLKKKRIKQRKIKYNFGQIPQWMIAFLNFLYPLLVLLSECYYFLIIVFVVKVIQTVLFVKHSEKISLLKKLQLASFVCELVFNCTFFVFAATKSNQLLVIISCFICLSSFFLGAIINILIVLIQTVIFLWSIKTSIFKFSKISPLKPYDEKILPKKCTVKPSFALSIKNLEIKQSSRDKFQQNVANYKIFTKKRIQLEKNSKKPESNLKNTSPYKNRKLRIISNQ